MSQEKLRTVSVVEALSKALSEAIFRMEYLPGQQITEGDVVSRFNVSRNTVREATASLILNGLLVKEANKGIFVKKIQEADVREIFHFRMLLETEAVHFIIRNGRKIPQQLITSMESIELDPFIQRDWYRFVSSDLTFHAELVRASNSVRLMRLYDAIRQEIMLCICQSESTLILNPRNIYEHRQFIEKLESGTEEEAVALVTNHINYGVENLAKGFQTQANA